jgi:hypothetical protein
LSPTPRDDRDGVASTVATLLSLFLFLMFFELAVLGPIPAHQQEEEWRTSHEAAEAFGILRSTAGLAPAGSTFSVPMPLGTEAVSPLASASPGVLGFDSTATGATISFRFVPNFHQAEMRKIDQDVLMLMDSSGSMVWNDPLRLRITAAQEYVGQLVYPDRVAFVDFDDVARLTKRNVGGVAHHLNTPGHEGIPDYAEAQTDLDTIDNRGGTNFGDAIRIANDELQGYGDRRHAWVMILLTDGENNQQWQDDLARTQSQRAKALGITIYTIGLGSDPDAGLLTEIAANTGGTYYAAPNPESLRWIYLEISRRYQSSFSCGIFATSDASSGVLSLDLATHEYPPQTFLLEAGGLSVVQREGSVVREGMPFEYRATGDGAGTLSLTMLSFIGADRTLVGTGKEIVRARVIGDDSVEQRILKVRLDEEARAIANVSASVQSWADQGAATQAAASAVRTLLAQAEASVRRAFDNSTSGEIEGAKFDVDRAESQLSAAEAEAAARAAAQQMQSWLAAIIRDDVLASGCRLEQWRNWYDGITITFDSPAAPGWAAWFNETFSNLGAPVTVGAADGHAVISLHSIDVFTLDRRIVELSFGSAGPRTKGR